MWNLSGYSGSRVGVEDRFAELVRAKYEPLRRAAFVLCGDVDQADDLVQNALVRALRARQRVLGAADADAYLYVLLVNTYRTGLRRRWRGEVPSAEVAPVGVPGAALPDVASRVDVLRALASLSPAHRRTVVLRYMADLSEQATAEALGCSVGTVKSRSARALAALRADAGAMSALGGGQDG